MSFSVYTVLAMPCTIQQACLWKSSAARNSVLTHNQKLQIRRQWTFIRPYQIPQSQIICNHALKVSDHPNFYTETIWTGCPPDSITCSTLRTKLLVILLFQLDVTFKHITLTQPCFFFSRGGGALEDPREHDIVALAESQKRRKKGVSRKTFKAEHLKFTFHRIIES